MHALWITRAYGPGMQVTYNKLIRDRIPEVIQADGRRAVTRVLDSCGYQSALLAKLVEEANEAQMASADDLPGELADILEVLQTLVAVLAMTWEELLLLASAKRRQRGGFTQRPLLEYIE
jgi:predicted house-cleaning noncanonical NTP pyrophosphatase (MazG superfamily)